MIGIAVLCLVRAVPTSAQAAESPLKRWVDLQAFTIYTRYRLTTNSQAVTTSDQLQYKDAFRARVNLDRGKRYTVGFAYGSGASFISSWNDWGAGHGTHFVGDDHAVRQLFASAEVADGIELQYGGLFLNRGQADEFLTYDDDGYVAGERLTIRRPRLAYFDEITVTRAALGPFNTPALNHRWDGLAHPNYTQVLVGKRLGERVGGSMEYDRQLGSDIVRAAAAVRLQKWKLRTARYEQYWRSGPQSATGVGAWVDSALPGNITLQGGFVRVDEFYGGWNADRMQTGPRWFAIGTIPIANGLSASLYATRALNTSYAIPIRWRFDAVISYDVLDGLRRAHVF